MHDIKQAPNFRKEFLEPGVYNKSICILYKH